MRIIPNWSERLWPGFGRFAARSVRSSVYSFLVLGITASLATLHLLAGDPSGFGPKSFQAKKYKVSQYYESPNETQIKSQLEGGKALPMGDGRVLQLSDGVTLRTYSITNTPELLVQTSQCLYDPTLQTANSTSTVRVQTADGKFSIEGEGFFWCQTNSALFISNRVHTTVQSEMIESGGVKNQVPAGPGAGGIEIFSDRFNFSGDSDAAVYSGNMKVTGTNMLLVGNLLTLKVPMAERQLRSIIAEQNVTIDYTNEAALHATGEKAVYDAVTGLIEMTGEPTWKAGPRTGRGDMLTLDRTNRIFRVDGKAWLRMPGSGLSDTGLIPQGSASNSASTRLNATNQFLEVSSGSYEIRTNLAIFQNQVRVSERLGGQERSQMVCDTMTVTFSGSNQLQRLEALNHVVIEQETNRFTGAKAIYTAANGLLEMTGNPTWRSGLREGKGNVLLVNTNNEMVVRGKASMRLPAEELAQSSMGPGGGTPPARGGARKMEFAEIFCEEYRLRPESAVFRGGVYASHPSMNWACETLTVSRPSANGPVETLTAEQTVVFDLVNDKGEKVHGTGDKAVYTYTVHGNVTNDVLNLTGAPAMLERTNITVWNNLIILDRVKNTIAAPGGQYKVRGSAPIDTNAFKGFTIKPGK